MIFQYLEYPNFQAFRRLILMILKKQGALATQSVHAMIELATYHGISKEDAHEIYDYCLDDYKLTTY
jgi:DNA-binding transcriptional regulator YhcF (GntR family)